MAAAQALGGFTGPEADTLGYAIRKKKSSLLRAQREKFVSQAAERGVTPHVIDQVFAAFQPFERYGFNKAHATCYGLIAYQTAYLKANYPVEYMTSVLNAFRDNAEKVAGAIAECRRLGIEVLPPDVHRSDTLFAVEGDAIRFGLLAVRNVGHGAIEAIVAAREAGGPFGSLVDFCARVDLRLANRRVLESLIRVGALKDLGHPAQLLDALDEAMAAGQVAQRDRLSGQASLFELAGEPSAFERPLPNVSEVPLKERLRWEKELLGLYLSDHPLGDIADELGGFVTAYSGEFGEELDQQRVVVGGVVVGLRPVITKSRQTMGVATLEDLQGSLEVIVFPKVLEETRAQWVEEAIVLVGGRVDHKGDATVLLAEWIMPWEEARVRGPAAVQALLSVNGRQRRRPDGGDGRTAVSATASVPVASPPVVRISPLRAEEGEEEDPADDLPEEPPLPDEVARTLPTAPSAPTSPLGASPGARLHVRFASFGQERLVPAFEEVARALRGRPGETPVVLHIPLVPGHEETMEARYRVAFDPELLAEISRRVDPALVTLELAEG